MKIAFVGNYEYHCGSSNALLGYIKAGKKLNYDIRPSEFGYIDSTIRSSIPTADKSWQPDLLVIVYESYSFLSEEQIEKICSKVPRSKRIIIDPDGKYSSHVSYNNDTNHSTSDSYEFWTDLYNSLSDIILQPFFGDMKNKNAQSFLFFGMDNNLPEFGGRPKDFDLLYVGNNWYRWHAIERFIKMLTPIRSRLKK